MNQSLQQNHIKVQTKKPQLLLHKEKSDVRKRLLLISFKLWLLFVRIILQKFQWIPLSVSPILILSISLPCDFLKAISSSSKNASIWSFKSRVLVHSHSLLWYSRHIFQFSGFTVVSLYFSLEHKCIEIICNTEMKC